MPHLSSWTLCQKDGTGAESRALTATGRDAVLNIARTVFTACRCHFSWRIAFTETNSSVQLGSGSVYQSSRPVLKTSRGRSCLNSAAGAPPSPPPPHPLHSHLYLPQHRCAELVSIGCGTSADPDAAGLAVSHR